MSQMRFYLSFSKLVFENRNFFLFSNSAFSKYSKISVLIFRFLPMIYSLSVKIEFLFGGRGHSVTVVLSNAVTLAFKGVL